MINQVKYYLAIGNILKCNSISNPNSILSYFDGIRLKNKGTKGRALVTTTMKNIVYSLLGCTVYRASIQHGRILNGAPR